MKQALLTVSAIFALTFLQGCLPDSPDAARQSADDASSTAKGALTAVGEKTENGLASSKRTLTEFGEATENATEALKSGLTSFGETVGSLRAQPEKAAPAPSGGPVVFEREPATP